jgi:methylamine dehydrogenase accessory protein MauD
MCKKLLGVARSFMRSERRHLWLALIGDGERAEQERLIREHKLEGFPYVVSPVVGMTYQVGKLPYAVLIDERGVVRGKGLVNSREQLESLFTAKELGVASIQAFVDQQA